MKKERKITILLITNEEKGSQPNEKDLRPLMIAMTTIKKAKEEQRVRLKKEKEKTTAMMTESHDKSQQRKVKTMIKITKENLLTRIMMGNLID